MPKILHLNCSCTGSTGKIISDIADHLTDAGYDMYLCAPCAPGQNRNIRYFRTSLPYEQGIYRRLNLFYGFQYGFAPFSTARIKGIIRRLRPDLIHIHCVNGYMVNIYALLRLIKREGIPLVFTNHAEFFYTGGCPYAFDCEKWMTGCGSCPQRYLATGAKYWDTSAIAWRRNLKAFSSLDRAVMVSVSPWVQNRAQRSPITAALDHRTVLNGVNTDVFTWRDPAALRAKYGFIPDTRIIFHPTANFSTSPEDRKGGRFILELARRWEGRNLVFVVAGKHSKDLDVPGNMILLGRISDQMKLAEYYAMADVTVVAGKRETFNMPVAESLCCGTPVAGFLAGGPESIAMEEYCRFAEYGDVDSLQAAVSELLDRPDDKKEISRQGTERYTSAVMAEDYRRVYNQILSDGRMVNDA